MMSSLRNVKERFASQGKSDASAQENPGGNFDNQVKELIPAEVRMISGCHSLETSADISNIHRIDRKGNLPSPEGRAGGACTTALLSILYDSQKQNDNTSNSKDVSFQQILLKLREKLSQSGLSQIPQLTSSRPLELEETPFSLTGGTQRALLVGINYHGQSGQLSGCINDVQNVKKYLCNYQGFEEKHVLLLIDDGSNHYPTRENIIRALRRLVDHSKAGDSVYFHYSGHGGLLHPDYWNRYKAAKPNKDYDETLYPVDHVNAGQIRDFSLFNHFVKPMAAGVTVTCVMDCCHSGSVLDLPYSYRPTADGKIRMKQSMDSLTNLAFLYILAGGMLPDLGFESVTENLQNVTGETIDNLQGVGVEEFSSDVDGWNNGVTDGTGDYSPTNMEETSYTGGNFGNDDGNAMLGGDEADNADFFNRENTTFNNDGDAFDTSGVVDGFDAGDYGGDADCGGNDCDGCDAVGEILSTLLDDL